MHASAHKYTYPPAPLWGSTAVRSIAVLLSCSSAVTVSCPTALLSPPQVVSQQSVFSVQWTVPLLKCFPADTGSDEIASQKIVCSRMVAL